MIERSEVTNPFWRQCGMAPSMALNLSGMIFTSLQDGTGHFQ